MGSAVLLLLVVAATVDVGVESSCPSPQQVDGQLQLLLPERSSHVANVTRAGALLSVTLLDAAGRALVHREVTSPERCEDAAELAATLIASWESDLRAQALELQTSVSEKPKPAIAWEAGAAGVASFAGSIAPGAFVYVSLAPEKWMVAGEAVVSMTGLRQLPLGPGFVRWRWTVGGLGLRARLLDRWVRLEVHAQGLLGSLDAEGVGYAGPRPPVRTVQLGVLGGGRASIPLGPVRLWLGAAVAGWLKSQHLEVGQLADPTGAPLARQTLPRLELLLMGGVSFGSK